MKKHARIFVVLLIVILTASILGCSKDSGVLGKYKRENNKVDYIELKSDNTFFLIQDNVEYTGQYQLDGTKLTLKGAEGMMAEGTLDGDTITDDDQIIWKK